MGRYILHIEARYFEWSTVCDAAVTEPMTRDTFETYYRAEYGEKGMRELPTRLARAERTGSSAYDLTFEDTVFINRMGPGESEMSLDEIRAWARRAR